MLWIYERSEEMMIRMDVRVKETKQSIHTAIGLSGFALKSGIKNKMGKPYYF